MATHAAEISTGVSSTLVADQVYEVLAGRIFTGELHAGARLRVRDIAEQVGTSVMPVREAVRLLVENGLAVSHPHRGPGSVSSPSASSSRSTTSEPSWRSRPRGSERPG
ncbi:GntR family transcriptional regulator [Streptomyces scabiei]|uniref:GntR family transcriptional regulator n=1 Tax=Streptomyces scabiei TaxID=1930 RepID=UPI0029BB3589|nr:GntR family transcriptional regulator [Streptomyces scabiei]MDX3448678.1 GntR family transcriptional regulator [Streptomyces scabiei]MDX3461662.1 GntR family transcriptional regulator [Streptomyces scabiei]